MFCRWVMVLVLSLVGSSVGITPLGAQETTGSVQPAKRDVVEAAGNPIELWKPKGVARGR